MVEMQLADGDGSASRRDALGHRVVCSEHPKGREDVCDFGDVNDVVTVLLHARCDMIEEMQLKARERRAVGRGKVTVLSAA